MSSHGWSCFSFVWRNSCAPCFTRKTPQGFDPLSFYTGKGRTMREAFRADRGFFSWIRTNPPEKKKKQQRDPSRNSPTAQQKDFGGTESSHRNSSTFRSKGAGWVGPRELHRERHLWLAVADPAHGPPGTGLGNALPGVSSRSCSHLLRMRKLTTLKWFRSQSLTSLNDTENPKVL